MSGIKIDLHQVFLGHQTEMFQRMETARKNIAHAPSMGDEGESEWIDLFRHFLPKRYEADKAFVIDCNGAISEQVDVVIFDRQYSPFLARFKNATYVPAESVYAIFEVKQDLSAAHIDYAAKKAASVRALRRTTTTIKHAGGVYTPREPFNILAGLLCHANSWQSSFGKPFISALNALQITGQLNLGCCLEAGSFFINWETGAPVPRVSEEDTSLVTFVLGLIHELQQLGTAPALDLNAYLNPLLHKPKTIEGSVSQGSKARAKRSKKKKT